VNYFVSRYGHAVWILLNFISTQNYGLIQVGLDMRFSIIIATINRTKENFRLLKSIAAQQYNDIEVIFADQIMMTG